MPAASSFVVAADHPSLAGHFPGRPIVPGVVLLEEAMALAPRTEGGPFRLRSAKFVRSVLPGEEVHVIWSKAPGGRAAFVGSVAGREVLRGQAAADGPA